MNLGQMHVNLQKHEFGANSREFAKAREFGANLYELRAPGPNSREFAEHT